MAQGDQIISNVDSYAAILDELEGRMVANTTAGSSGSKRWQFSARC